MFRKIINKILLLCLTMLQLTLIVIICVPKQDGFVTISNGCGIIAFGMSIFCVLINGVGYIDENDPDGDMFKRKFDYETTGILVFIFYFWSVYFILYLIVKIISLTISWIF